MALRGGTVRAYLQAIGRVATIPGATEHTYRAALGEFLVAAAAELGFGHITVRSELRLADVGQPDLQVVNGDGVAIGYGETKQPGTAARFAEVLESEQVTRYRSTLENLLTDRKDRVLDIDQIRMYLQAITAVRTAIELGAALDAALAEVLAGPLVFDGGA